MDEKQVKAAALMRLREAYSRRRKKPIITAEFSLGSSGVRADLAVFSEKIIGIEIKTARDTLRRLPAQMDAYSRYFDHVIAIVAPCHLPNLAGDQLYGASVWTYNGKGTISVLRVGISNVINGDSLNDLLTQAERRKCNFRTAIEARYAATSRHFWRSVSRRSIRPEDLPLLSRFADDRERAKHFTAERYTRWSQWLAAQGCFESA